MAREILMMMLSPAVVLIAFLRTAGPAGKQGKTTWTTSDTRCDWSGAVMENKITGLSVATAEGRGRRLLWEQGEALQANLSSSQNRFNFFVLVAWTEGDVEHH